MATPSRRIWRVLAYGCLLSLGMAALFGQAAPLATEQAPEPSPSATADTFVVLPPRSVLLVCRFAASADFTPAQKQLLFESLTLRLGAASSEVRIREYPDLALSADADLNQMAILSGIDAWISVKVSGGMKNAVVQVRAYDLQNSRDFFVVSVQGAIDPRFRNAFSGLWSPIEQQLTEKIHQNRQLNAVTFQAPAGTIIGMESDKTVGSEGSLSFTLMSPATYQWRAYLPGYRAQYGSLFIDTDTTFSIEPKPYFKAQFELGLEWLSFPTLRSLINMLPDELDLEIGLVFYNLGIVPSFPTDPEPSLFHDYGLVNVLFGLRWYPLKHRYELRPWLGAGIQMRFLTSPNLSIDTLSPGGFYVQMGFSLDIIPELALFLELTPRIIYTRDIVQALNGPALGGTAFDGLNTRVYAGSFIIEPWHFIFGLRFQP